MLITLVQIAVVIGFLAKGKISKISFKPIIETVQVDEGLENRTTYDRVVPTNMFVGPDTDFIVQ